MLMDCLKMPANARYKPLWFSCSCCSMILRSAIVLHIKGMLYSVGWYEDKPL